MIFSLQEISASGRGSQFDGVRLCEETPVVGWCRPVGSDVMAVADSMEREVGVGCGTVRAPLSVLSGPLWPTGCVRPLGVPAKQEDTDSTGTVRYGTARYLSRSGRFLD